MVKTVDVGMQTKFYELVKPYMGTKTSFDLFMFLKENSFELSVRQENTHEVKISSGEVEDGFHLAQEVIKTISSMPFKRDDSFGIHADVLLDGQRHYLTITGFDLTHDNKYYVCWKIKPVKEMNKDIIACENLADYALLRNR